MSLREMCQGFLQVVKEMGGVDIGGLEHRLKCSGGRLFHRDRDEGPMALTHMTHIKDRRNIRQRLNKRPYSGTGPCPHVKEPLLMPDFNALPLFPARKPSLESESVP